MICKKAEARNVFAGALLLLLLLLLVSGRAVVVLVLVLVRGGSQSSDLSLMNDRIDLQKWSPNAPRMLSGKVY